jgi:ABC-type antimicrobial peptide transport system permease subunit
MARGYVGAILVTPGLAAQALLLAVASAVAGALLPAWRASRMTIVDAIRRGR